MWRVTLVSNLLILTLLWLLSLVAITPAHNLLVQYADTIQVLPILTDWAIQFRPLTLSIPLFWAAATLMLGLKLARFTPERRSEYLSAHTSLTLTIGLTLFLLYLLAGILPLLKIGATLG